MTPTLDFSTNWNGKLHCQIFHTIRRSGRFDVGQLVEVYLKENLLGTAQCVAKTRYPNASSIPEVICLLDTGYGSSETQTILARMYKDEDPDLVPIYGYLFKWQQTTAKKTELKPVVQLAFELTAAFPTCSLSGHGRGSGFICNI